MKKLVVAWVAGFLFAIALVVRWQVMANPPVAAGNAAAGPERTDELEPAVSQNERVGARLRASAGWEAIRIGARTDLRRLQKLLQRESPDDGAVPEPAVDTLDLTIKAVSASAG